MIVSPNQIEPRHLGCHGRGLLNGLITSASHNRGEYQSLAASFFFPFLPPFFFFEFVFFFRLRP